MIKSKVKLNKFRLKQMETTKIMLHQEKLGTHIMVPEVILRIIGNWDTKNKGKKFNKCNTRGMMSSNQDVVVAEGGGDCLRRNMGNLQANNSNEEI